MSNALAIASVTAVLKDLLDNALVDHSVVLGAAVTVSVVAPDLIQLDGNSGPQLNLYLYGVTPNQGWRNEGLPSHSGDGQRLSNPPLALDLHYLLTAYGQEDFQTEILLGYGMQVLHETPVLTRDAIRTTLGPVSPVVGSILPPALASLSAADLADQVELVKITPETMSTEEISKLWTAFSASYRPSAAYRATVVLIEADEPVRSPLPVLTRGPADSGPVVVTGLIPPYPTLTAICPPDENPSAELGEIVQLLGHHLDGAVHNVVFAHPRRTTDIEITPLPDDVSANAIAIALTEDPVTDTEEWPAGLWAVHVDVTLDGTKRTTNTLPLLLAPTIATPIPPATTIGNTTTFEIDVKPHVWPEQSASLVVGQDEVVAEEHSSKTNQLTFAMEDVATGSSPYVRLRVDGVESHLVDRTKSPPEFDETQKVAVP